jgi:hypothetical protein
MATTVQVLGSGYNTDTLLASITPCVNINSTNTIYTAGSQGTLTFGYNLGIQNIVAEQGFTLAISEGIEFLSLFSSEAGIQFSNALQNSQLMQSLLFTQSINCPTQTFVPSGYGIGVLSAFGQGAYEAGPEQFRISCGDQFVSQVSQGASLAVAIQMAFFNADDAASFYASSSSQGFLGLSESFSSITANLNIMAGVGEILILGYQNGGDANALPEIFGEFNGNYYVSSCTPANLDPCQSVINSIVNYSVNNFATNLFCGSEGNNGNAAIIGYSYQPYTDLGLNATQSLVTPVVSAARTELSEILANNTELLSALNTVQNTVGKYMSNTTLYQFQATLANVEGNINLLQGSNGIALCYQNPSNCPVQALEIIALLNKINQTFVDIFSTAYNLIYSGQLSPEVSQYSGMALPYGPGEYVVIGSNKNDYINITENNNAIVIGYSDNSKYNTSMINQGIWQTCVTTDDYTGWCLNLYEIQNPSFVDNF